MVRGLCNIFTTYFSCLAQHAYKICTEKSLEISHTISALLNHTRFSCPPKTMASSESGTDDSNFQCEYDDESSNSANDSQDVSSPDSPAAKTHASTATVTKETTHGSNEAEKQSTKADARPKYDEVQNTPVKPKVCVMMCIAGNEFVQTKNVCEFIHIFALTECDVESVCCFSSLCRYFPLIGDGSRG